MEASCAAILTAKSSSEIHLGGPDPFASSLASRSHNPKWASSAPLPQDTHQNAPEEELGHEKGGPTLAFSWAVGTLAQLPFSYLSLWKKSWAKGSWAEKACSLSLMYCLLKAPTGGG